MLQQSTLPACPAADLVLSVAVQSTMHWTRLFTRLLSEDVKLVGPTVSCQNVLHGVDPTLTVNLTSVPHVQFTAMATDQVSGLLPNVGAA